MAPTPPPDQAQLLDQLLDSLLEDFEYWFQRGELLLGRVPAGLLPPGEMEALGTQLREAQAALVATRALRAASPSGIAVAMDAMTPWHRLMMRIWSLSSLMRHAGIELPHG